jgi:nitrogen regulatory protein PII
MITAVIKPICFEDICEALTEIGISGITATEVSGFGYEKGRTELYRGKEYTFSVKKRVKIEVAVDDGQLEPAIEAITSIANTAQSARAGYGRVFVMPLEQSIRTRGCELHVAAA